MRDIGIGLIGAGLIGATHTVALKQIADLAANNDATPVRPVLIAASDTNAEHGASFAANWGYAHFDADPRDMMARADIDAVFVCTPTDAHAEHVAAAAQAGKHIFCEKPLAFTAHEAEAMWDAVADAGIVHQVGLVLRYSPLYRVLHALIEEHETGPLRTVLFRDDQCLPIRGVHRSLWRADVRRAGGGTIIEHSIHDLDLLRSLCGEITHVSAVLDYHHGHAGIEDYAGVTMDFAHGGDAHLVSVWHDIGRRESNRRLELFYQRAYFHVEGEAIGAIEYQIGDGPLKKLSPKAVRARAVELSGVDPASSRATGVTLFPYAAEDYAFLQAVVKRTPAFPGFEVAYAAHVVVDAIYRSGRAAGRSDSRRVAVHDPMADLEYPH